MPTLLERLLKKDTESFGVMDTQGGTWFVNANRCKLRGDTVVFLTGRMIVAIATSGTWQRVVRGLTLEDFEGGE